MAARAALAHASFQALPTQPMDDADEFAASANRHRPDPSANGAMAIGDASDYIVGGAAF